MLYLSLINKLYFGSLNVRDLFLSAVVMYSIVYWCKCACRIFLVKIMHPSLKSQMPPPNFFSMFNCFSEEMQVLRSQVQESKSLCHAAEVERDRLLELVTLLQRRWDSWVNEKDEESGEVGGGIVNNVGGVLASLILRSLRARLESEYVLLKTGLLKLRQFFSKPLFCLFLSYRAVCCSWVYMHSVYRSLDGFVSCLHAGKQGFQYLHAKTFTLKTL